MVTNFYPLGGGSVQQEVYAAVDVLLLTCSERRRSLEFCSDMLGFIFVRLTGPCSSRSCRGF